MMTNDKKIQKVLAIRSQAIKHLAALQPSGNARNYLLRYILEENCNITNNSPAFTPVGAISLLPPRNLINMMTVMLKAEILDDVSSTNVLNFKNVGIIFSLTIRNNVMNVKEEDSFNPDVKINVDLDDFR